MRRDESTMSIAELRARLKDSAAAAVTRALAMLELERRETS